MSRPEKPIDWKKVDELLMAGCMGNEIAGYFNIHPTNFYLRVEKEYNMSFTEYASKMHFKGESLLRAHQYAKALGLTDKGDNTLLIWLGKTRLKQRDHSSINPTSQITLNVGKDLASGVNIRTKSVSAEDNTCAE